MLRSACNLVTLFASEKVKTEKLERSSHGPARPVHARYPEADTPPYRTHESERETETERECERQATRGRATRPGQPGAPVTRRAAARDTVLRIPQAYCKRHARKEGAAGGTRAARATAQPHQRGVVLLGHLTRLDDACGAGRAERPARARVRPQTPSLGSRRAPVDAVPDAVRAEQVDQPNDAHVGLTGVESSGARCLGRPASRHPKARRARRAPPAHPHLAQQRAASETRRVGGWHVRRAGWARNASREG